MSKSRSRWLFGLLIMTVVLAYFSPDPQVAPVQETSRKTTEAGTFRQSPTDTEKLLTIRSRDQAMPVSSLVFDTLREPDIPRVQQVPPTVTSTAPQTVPLVQAAPVRPQVLGRYEEDGKAAVFVSVGGREYVVREGDRIEDQYEVKRVDPDSVVLLYLPQNELQTLATGER